MYFCAAPPRVLFRRRQNVKVGFEVSVVVLIFALLHCSLYICFLDRCVLSIFFDVLSRSLLCVLFRSVLCVVVVALFVLHLFDFGRR